MIIADNKRIWNCSLHNLPDALEILAREIRSASKKVRNLFLINGIGSDMGRAHFFGQKLLQRRIRGCLNSRRPALVQFIAVKQHPPTAAIAAVDPELCRGRVPVNHPDRRRDQGKLAGRRLVGTYRPANAYLSLDMCLRFDCRRKSESRKA